MEVPAIELPEYDFSKVCPCNECSEKTKALMEFEIDLKSKHDRIRKLYIQVFYDIEDFTNIIPAFVRTTETWACLQRSRKSLHEKSGVPLTRSKSEEDIRDVFSQICTILLNQERLNQFVLPDECEGHDDKPNHLNEKISSMFKCFLFTKFEDVVLNILSKMNEPENQDGKSAEEGEMSLNLSISKRHLDKQIKVFKELPFQDMYLEFETLAGRGVS
ncbi:unnamed protein product [Cuscuta europaea]|uniref:Uncharacterized protein n=1 Tax=Cuscuta europaea TaxID=41803 RepID=A0A9P1ELV2_CUSEU|nr:unnamed protein product [Cuscuta europaea]